MALPKRIIPCLDVTAGRVVKGVNFLELRDAGDPVEIARRYDAQGADELTFLDITASSDGRDLILDIVEAVASQVFIPLTVGGGVHSIKDVEALCAVQEEGIEAVICGRSIYEGTLDLRSAQERADELSGLEQQSETDDL